MAYPPPRLACNGLSRHILGRRLPPVFHDPLHAAQLWIVRAYRDRPTLTSSPPPAARSRAKGLAAFLYIVVGERRDGGQREVVAGFPLELHAEIFRDMAKATASQV